MPRSRPAQKAALTRAIKDGRAETIRDECIRTIAEWESSEWHTQHGTNAWPDDWFVWQNALNDALPWNQGVQLAELWEDLL